MADERITFTAVSTDGNAGEKLAETARKLRPLGPDGAPHCRNHIQFRSDCEACRSAREFE